jgi:hypothetical protein
MNDNSSNSSNFYMSSMPQNSSGYSGNVSSKEGKKLQMVGQYANDEDEQEETKNQSKMIMSNTTYDGGFGAGGQQN